MMGALTASARSSQRWHARRSVVAGSFIVLLGGSTLLSTAVPVWASAHEVAPTTATVVTTSTTSTVATTTTTIRVVRRAHVAKKSPATPAPGRAVAKVPTEKVALVATKKVAITKRLPVRKVTHVAKAKSAAVAITHPKKVATVAKTTPTTTPKAPAPPRVPSFSNLKLAANITPDPNFMVSGSCTKGSGVWLCANPCVTTSLSWPTYTSAQTCTDYVLQAINNARATEGIHAMVLPTNWNSLNQSQQLFVVADLERTARGLAAYLGINSALSANAQRAAQTNADPSIAAGFAIGNDAQGYPGMGGAWSGGFSVLAADYVWMYDDGWGGSASATSNIGCTSSQAIGCWAHREELLGSDPGYNPGVGLGCQTCEMGTGYAVVGSSSSYVDLIELPKSTPPAMTFTWANNVLPFLS